MGIEDEGSISFRVRHEDKDWATNDKLYDFPPVQAGPIRAHVLKHPTKRIEIRLEGPLRSELVFDGKLPPVSEEGLSIAVTWNPQQVRLYLDGKPYKSVDLTQPGAPGNGGAGGSATPAPEAPRRSDA